MALGLPVSGTTCLMRKVGLYDSVPSELYPPAAHHRLEPDPLRRPTFTASIDAPNRLARWRCPAEINAPRGELLPWITGEAPSPHFYGIVAIRVGRGKGRKQESIVANARSGYGSPRLGRTRSSRSPSAGGTVCDRWTRLVRTLR